MPTWQGPAGYGQAWGDPLPCETFNNFHAQHSADGGNFKTEITWESNGFVHTTKGVCTPVDQKPWNKVPGQPWQCELSQGLGQGPWVAKDSQDLEIRE